MAAPYEKTRHAGIYLRGSRYYVRQRDAAGRMATRSASTIAKARNIQAQMRTKRTSGSPMPKPQSFTAYADEWIETYAGRTGRGFRDSTRSDYRASIEKHAKPYFGRMQLSQIQPRDIKGFAAHLASVGLSPASVTRYIAPVKAMLATAFEDGIINANPSANVRTAVPRDSGGEERAKALSEAELERLVGVVDEQWQPFVEFLSRTGMRIGEAVAVQWRDVDLEARAVRVSRAVYKGVVDEPKSRYGKRSIPLTPKLVNVLAELKTEAGRAIANKPVFATVDGTMIDPANFRSRVMRPAAEDAGVPWATPHTLRHTFASRCFRHGCNVKQVQAMLGHHSPAFTLETYVHLLPEDLPDLEFLDG